VYELWERIVRESAKKCKRGGNVADGGWVALSMAISEENGLPQRLLGHTLPLVKLEVPAGLVCFLAGGVFNRVPAG
jgi:hypothetical protein